MKKIIFAALFVAISASPLLPPKNFLNYRQFDEPAEFKEYQFRNGEIIIEDISLNLDDDITYRLPNNTRPIRYDIWVKTDVEKEDFNFQGRVKIQIHAAESTDYVTLQYRDLIIDKIDLLDIEDEKIRAQNLFFEYLKPLTHEFLYIHLPNGVNSTDRFILDISYHGELHDADNNGFYKAYYENANGDIVWYATTKFEPHHARHLMPCYDEPAIRAPISLQVQHDKSYNTYSNMPLKVLNVLEGSDYVISVFEDTPPMQTYLLAFLTSAFKYISNNATDIEQRIFAKPQSIDDGEAEFASSITNEILKKFEELLDVKYPLPKLDHAAITQFPSGAMENFGFISYREAGLLLFKNYTTSDIEYYRKYITRLIAHEVTHQWFGNTVAPQWWTYLWLNEGFATLYSYLVPHILYPNLGFDEDHRVSNIQSSLINDVVTNPSSVPMSHYVEEPSAIRGRFNYVSYQKSGAVLMMFLEAIGSDIFHRGLTTYLNENYFGIGDPNKLFTALQASHGDKSQLNIEAVMSSWTSQAGYPIIQVERNGNKFSFSQKRYPTGNDEIFSIPLTFATKSNPIFDKKTASYWMNERREEVDVKVFGLNDNDWIIFNNQQVGFYRVGYSDDLWLAIANGLKNDSEKIHLVNRRILQEELLIGLSVSKNIFASTMLEILSTLETEMSHLVWNDANANIQYLTRTLFGTNVDEIYMKFLQTITKPIIDVIGLEETDADSLDTVQLRLRVKAINCYAFDNNCMQHEHTKLINYRKNEDEIKAPDFCSGFRLAEKDIYDHYLSELITNLNLKNRNEILRAIHCTLNEGFLGVLVEAIEDKKNIFTADERTVIINSMLISSKISFNVAFDYIRRNVEEISSFKSQLKIAINTQETFDELKLLLSEAFNDKILTRDDIDEIENAIKDNLKWHEKHLDGIKEFFGINDEIETTTLAANGILVPFYLIAAALIANHFVRQSIVTF